MIRLVNFFTLLLSFMLITGCTASNTSFGDYYQPTLTPAEHEQEARVYLFYPNPNYLPGQLSTALYIRGNKIVNLPNSGYTIVYLKPGTYTIETLPYNLITNQRVDAGLKLSSHFKANQSYYIGVMDKAGYAPTFYGVGKNMTPSVQTEIVNTKLVMYSANSALAKISLCRYVSPSIQAM